MNANLPVLFAGTVLTMNPRRPRATALGVRGSRIVAVGREQEVAAALGPGLRRVELGAQVLLPGFIDPHHHLGLAALDRRGPSLALPPVNSLPALFSALATAIEGHDREWVRAHGYDPQSVREQRAPTAGQLDEVCADRPLLLLADTYHEAVANTAALRALGIDRHSPDPAGGVIARDRRGHPTGLLVEAAAFAAEARSRDMLLARDADGWLDGCRAHARAVAEAGIVRLGDAAVPPVFDALYERLAGDLPLIVHRMPVSAGSILVPRVDAPPTGSGPDTIPVGPAKLLADGGERCATVLTAGQVVQAAGQILRGLVRDRDATLGGLRRSGGLRPGGDRRFRGGIRVATDEQLHAAVAAASSAGLQVAIHAIGNEAVESAMAAIVANGDRSLPGRPRIEHALLLDAALASRLAAGGITVVVQPSFVATIGDHLRHLPAPQPLRILPFRTLVDAGVEVAASSDHPAAGFGVMAGVAAAVTRRTASGAKLYAGEALTVEEALHAYTLSAARALGVEREAGTLGPGKRADLVTLDRDPTAVPPGELAAVGVTGTWIAGRRVSPREG